MSIKVPRTPMTDCGANSDGIGKLSFKEALLWSIRPRTPLTDCGANSDGIGTEVLIPVVLIPTELAPRC